MAQNDVLREHLLPVLLGDTPQAHGLALRIYLHCGVVSYICDTRRHVLDYCNPTGRFFPVCHSDKGTLLSDSLCYLAADPDLLPVLIPCSDEHAAYIEAHRALLEQHFLIRTADTLFDTAPLSDFRTRRAAP